MRYPDLVVQGEPELGVQRWCQGCQEWWPLTPEFYHRSGPGTPSGRHRYDRTCKACKHQANIEAARRYRERKRAAA